MTINSTAIILLALYVAVARRQGVRSSTLSGTIQNDILKEYVARGTYIYPPRAVAAHRHRHLRVLRARAAELEHDLDQRLSHPRSRLDRRRRRSRSRSPTPSRTSRRRVDAGLDVNRFGQRLSFFFNAHNDFLEEVAKFRAARRLWARIMRDRFGATNPRAQQLRFHTQTAGSTLTAQQPDNNIVRVAHAGARRGARRHAVAALQRPRRGAGAADRGIGAHRAAHAADHRARERRRQHASIRSAASYAIEDADQSDRARGARRCSTRIDAAGGTLAAIEQGCIQREIQESAYRAQQAIDAGERVVVGVNQFATSR